MSEIYQSNGGNYVPEAAGQQGLGQPGAGRVFTLRLVEVTSVVVVTHRRTRVKTGTMEELQKFSRGVMLHNLLLGWWGIPFGIVWTIMALISNSKADGKLRQLAASPPANTGAGVPPAVGAGSPAAPVGGQQPAAVPAGWHPDPSGQHPLRYWDGTSWTEHVTDAQGNVVARPQPA